MIDQFVLIFSNDAFRWYSKNYDSIIRITMNYSKFYLSTTRSLISLLISITISQIIFVLDKSSIIIYRSMINYFLYLDRDLKLPLHRKRIHFHRLKHNFTKRFFSMFINLDDLAYISSILFSVMFCL